MIVKTGKFLPEDVAVKAHALFTETRTAPAIVLSDRGGRVSAELFGEARPYPLTEPEIATIRYHRLVNAEAVKLGLAPAEEFIDADGDEAINNYGVDFKTREVLFWDRHAVAEVGDGQSR